MGDRRPACGSFVRDSMQARALAVLRDCGPTHYKDLAAELYPDAPAEVQWNRITSLLATMRDRGLVRRSGRRGIWEATDA
jgi:hypothetical protein